LSHIESNPGKAIWTKYEVLDPMEALDRAGGGVDGGTAGRLELVALCLDL
jgi:hypothetical protein